MPPDADSANGRDDRWPGPAACSLSEVVEQVSGKWSIGVLLAASHGPVRFTELERKIQGISRRMLTRTLRSLERDGLLIRTAYPTVPVKVEYALSPVAVELCESLTGLTHWAQRHHAFIEEARRSYDHPASAETA